MALGGAHTEREAIDYLARLAARNRALKSMIGLGYYDTITPPVVQRNVLENPGWYTAYTPYQPEISQGRLEALLGFQTMVADLTGMELANASLLDEATAAAEAMTMSRSLSKSWRLDLLRGRRLPAPDHRRDPHPRRPPGHRRSSVGDPEADLEGHEVFGVLLQYPGAEGAVRDIRGAIEAAHAKGALVTVATDLLSLLLLTPPGELGADVVVGNSQRFGVPLGFGGPHAAFFATRDAHKRASPGRIVGVSVDARGRPALRLALQTREQHIRREKASSNICTAQVLLAVMAGLYAVYHGPEGLRRIAGRVHRLAAALRAGLGRLGFAAANAAFFDTLAVRVPGAADAVCARAVAAGINLRRIDADTVGISADETTTRADIETLWRGLRGRGRARLRLRRGRGGGRGRHPASPCAGPRTASPTRSSRATIPRPRCCATCAGSRRRTWPSTGR